MQVQGTWFFVGIIKIYCVCRDSRLYLQQAFIFLEGLRYFFQAGQVGGLGFCRKVLGRLGFFVFNRFSFQFRRRRVVGQLSSWVGGRGWFVCIRFFVCFIVFYGFFLFVCVYTCVRLRDFCSGSRGVRVFGFLGVLVQIGGCSVVRKLLVGVGAGQIIVFRVLR